MKYLMILTVLFIYSCQQLTPEEKAAKSIESKMEKIEGYKPVAYGELERFFITKYYLPEMKELREQIKKHQSTIKGQSFEQFSYSDSINNEISKSHDAQLIAMDNKNIPPKFFGYTIKHKYIHGNDQVADTTFILDQNYNVVLKDTLTYR